MVTTFIVFSFLFILISLAVILYFLSSERGASEPKKALWIALCFGILSTTLIHFTFVFLDLQPPTLSSTVGGLPIFFLIILAAAFLEEIFKFAPLALFIYKKKYFSEHTDGIIYFAIAGLTFEVLENIAYMLLADSLSTGLLIGYTSLFYFPIFHGTTTGIAGYYLAKQKIGNGSIGKTIFALATVSFLHGFLNFGKFYGDPILSILPIILKFALIFALFVFFKKAKKEDQALGLTNKESITPEPKSSGKGAIVSLIIAILGFFVSLLSIIGLAMGAFSLVLGFSSVKSKRKVFAIIAIIISIIVILIALSLWIPPILNPDVTSLLLPYQ